MVKKIIWALSSGLLAGGVSYFYGEMFEQQLFEDYSNVVPTPAIFISCLVGTIFATLGHWLLIKFIPSFGEFLFALIFAANNALIYNAPSLLLDLHSRLREAQKIGK